jgi:8-oxo-dGTP pyrophosphatase MutT (NUDIX family)
MIVTRVRATSYITRATAYGPELLVFEYPAVPEAAVQLPGGGVEPGERPDAAAIREAVEETGIAGCLQLRGVVGLQDSTYANGKPCLSVYFHLVTDEPRDEWQHLMVGDDDAWDTGLVVSCRFVSLSEADKLLSSSGYRQGEFLHFLDAEPI